VLKRGRLFAAPRVCLAPAEEREEGREPQNPHFVPRVWLSCFVSSSSSIGLNQAHTAYQSVQSCLPATMAEQLYTPKRTVEASHLSAQSAQHATPGGSTMVMHAPCDDSTTPMINKCLLLGKTWEEVYQILVSTAGTDASRLGEIVSFMSENGSRRGGKEIVGMVEVIIKWGWKPRNVELESKQMLTNPVSRTRCTQVPLLKIESNFFCRQL